MTVAEELTQLSEWLYLQSQEMYAKGLEATGDALNAQSCTAGALAGKCAGKVLVRPTISIAWQQVNDGPRRTTTAWARIAGVNVKNLSGEGSTEAEALANLQGLLDRAGAPLPLLYRNPATRYTTPTPTRRVRLSTRGSGSPTGSRMEHRESPPPSPRGWR